MTAPAPQKFTFDLNLAANGTQKQRLISEDEIARLTQEAEQRGYERGLSEGENSQLVIAQQQVAQGVQSLVAQGTQAVQLAHDKHEELKADAITLAVTTAKKLADNLIANQPLEPIRELMRECLASLEGAPHLVIRCHQDLADAIKELAEEQIATSGFSGRLIVMGEPDIGLSDARFEWADGGVVRDVEAITAEISDKIDQFTAPADEHNTDQESGDMIHE